MRRRIVSGAVKAASNVSSESKLVEVGKAALDAGASALSELDILATEEIAFDEYLLTKVGKPESVKSQLERQQKTIFEDLKNIDNRYNNKKMSEQTLGAKTGANATMPEPAPARNTGNITLVTPNEGVFVKAAESKKNPTLATAVPTAPGGNPPTPPVTDNLKTTIKGGDSVGPKKVLPDHKPGSGESSKGNDTAGPRAKSEDKDNTMPLLLLGVAAIAAIVIAKR